MKLQFKHQKFQADAAKAVVDVFAGQPYLTPTYMMDRGNRVYQPMLDSDEDFRAGPMQELYQDSLIVRFWNIFKKYSEIIRLSRPSRWKVSII